MMCRWPPDVLGAQASAIRPFVEQASVRHRLKLNFRNDNDLSLVSSFLNFNKSSEVGRIAEVYRHPGGFKFKFTQIKR